MNKQHILILAVFLAAFIIFCGIQINRKSVLLPRGEGLPESDIVFNKMSNTLGFINSDGKGYVERKVKPTGGWFSDLVHFYTILEISPYVTWSLDGKYLALSVKYQNQNPNIGFPLIFSEDGETIQCIPRDDIYMHRRIWIVNERNIVAVIINPFPEMYSVVIFDMTTCEKIKDLYKFEKVEYGLPTIDDMAYSNQGWLAIDIATKRIGTGVMIILDDHSREVVKIPNGLQPAWSRDGEWLAYNINNKGIWIIDKYGNNKQKILYGDYSKPSWSPDGQWIAFLEDMRMIGKINIVTKEVYPIYEGFANSVSWRWR